MWLCFRDENTPVAEELPLVKATALGNTRVLKVIRPSQTGVWNKTYL